MAILRQFDPIIIKDYVTDVFLYEPHGHTYYELIYIFKGKGIHLLNHNKIDYQADDLFLIAPGDEHHFEIKRPTRFLVIKFTEEYFNSRGDSYEIKPLTFMRMQALKETKITFRTDVSSFLKATMLNISSYQDHPAAASSSHLYFQLFSVFGLVQEAIVSFPIKRNMDKIDMQQLIDYIHQFIYEPEKCQIKNIAIRFNISPTYFGDYFKRTYHISYRDYLNQYRTSLIQKRIKSGKQSFKQIAEEFGFNDESHFSNFFKNQLKSSPSAYRKGISC